MGVWIPHDLENCTLASKGKQVERARPHPSIDPSRLTGISHYHGTPSRPINVSRYPSHPMPSAKYPTPCKIHTVIRLLSQCHEVLPQPRSLSSLPKGLPKDPHRSHHNPMIILPKRPYRSNPSAPSIPFPFFQFSPHRTPSRDARRRTLQVIPSLQTRALLILYPPNVNWKKFDGLWCSHVSPSSRAAGSKSKKESRERTVLTAQTRPASESRPGRRVRRRRARLARSLRCSCLWLRLIVVGVEGCRLRRRR